jgi:hypothetical protein
LSAWAAPPDEVLDDVLVELVELDELVLQPPLDEVLALVVLDVLEELDDPESQPPASTTPMRTATDKIRRKASFFLFISAPLLSLLYVGEWGCRAPSYQI